MKIKSIILSVFVLFNSTHLNGMQDVQKELEAPATDKFKKWTEDREKKAKQSKAERRAKWKPGTRRDIPKSFIRCVILMDDDGDESIKGASAIALDLISALKEDVDCIIVSHSILQNLLDRHNAGISDEFKVIPDINEWVIYDITNTQFYMFLHKKSEKFSITVQLDKATNINTEFPLFKVPDSKVKWNIDKKTFEKNISSSFVKINFKSIKNLYKYVKNNATRKTESKFNTSNLADIFVTPEYVLDSIKNEKSSLDQIYKYFRGDDWAKSQVVVDPNGKKDVKFKLDKAKKGIAHLNLLNYIKSELPQYNFYVSGHGAYLNSMAGIPLTEVPKVLIFKNQLNTKLVAISSCFSGGENLDTVFDELKKSIKNWDTIHYILAMLSTGDFITYQYANFSDFFSKVEAGVSDKKSIQSWLSQALKSVSVGNRNFWGGFITNSPQIMAPNVGWFSLIEVSENIQIINPVTLRKDEKEIEIKNKNVILLRNIDIISKPLIINAVQLKTWAILDNIIKLFALTYNEWIEGNLLEDSYVFPSIISAQSGASDYVFKNITINTPLNSSFIGILHFIRDAFFIMENFSQRATQKNFYIESLTGLNDFKQLFLMGNDAKPEHKKVFYKIRTGNDDLYKYLGEDSKPDTITLKNIYISTKFASGQAEIELIFTLPIEDAKTVYFRLYFDGKLKANKDILSADVIEGQEIKNAWRFEFISEKKRDSYFNKYGINPLMYPYFKSKIKYKPLN